MNNLATEAIKKILSLIVAVENKCKVMKGSTTSAAGESGTVPAPSAGASNRYLRSDGTWTVPPDNNTTYSNMTGASTSAAGKAGLVPAPSAGASTRYLRSDGTWTVPPDNNTTYSAGTGISLSGTAINNAGVRAVATGSANGTISVNTNGTAANVAVKGLGSAAYTNSTAYAAASHSHSYAGSASAGGSATSAVKLDTATAGSATQPVYFTGGKPVACSYTLGKSVPSNAVFTDTNTTYSNMKGSTASAAGTSGLVPAPSAGESNRYLRADGTWVNPKAVVSAEVTLASSSWTASNGVYVYSISNSNITATNKIHLLPQYPVDFSVLKGLNITNIVQASGTITLTSSTKPTGNITILLYIDKE